MDADSNTDSTDSTNGQSLHTSLKVWLPVAAGVLVLLVICCVVIVGVVCCRKKRRRRSRFSRSKSEGDAFSNITYGLFTGEEAETLVDEHGRPVVKPIDQSQHNFSYSESVDQSAHSPSQVGLETRFSPNRRHYTAVANSSPEAGSESFRRNRYNSASPSSFQDRSYASIDHHIKIPRNIVSPGSGDSVPIEERPPLHPPSPYELPVPVTRQQGVETPPTSFSTHPSLQKRESTLYQVPAQNEESLYCQLRELNKGSSNDTSVVLGNYLGSGQFGEVYRGVWLGPKGNLDAAIKTLREDAPMEDKVRFLQEAAIMGQFSHPNVVALYGVVVKDNKVFIAMELLLQGNLLLHLRSFMGSSGELAGNSGELVGSQQLLGYCRQTACGMQYLSGSGFIHRDLAARNILLSDGSKCKIADFGMSRDLMEGSYYIAHGGKIPVKWTAPEALNYRKYSTASDVWSYGALLYEIWSLGHKPYEGVDNQRVLTLLESGFRLAPPPGCSRSIYTLMLACWHPEAEKRPTFDSLVEQLSVPDEELLSWSENEDMVYAQAKQVGAKLNMGKDLYKDLQTQYLDQSDLKASISYEEVVYGSP